MAATQWETCSADALLRDFFAQDDLSRLAEGAGALLGCPLLVLDDTCHVAAHHLPLGFSDAVFQASVRVLFRSMRQARSSAEVQPCLQERRTASSLQTARIAAVLPRSSVRVCGWGI